MNNLLVRSLTGLVFVISVLGSAYLGIEVFGLVMGIYLLGALFEYARFFDNIEQVDLPKWPFVILGCLLYILLSLVFTSILLPGWSILILPLLFIASLGELWRKKNQPLLNLSAAFFGLFYLVLPFALSLLIVKNTYGGHVLIYGMFILIWSNDSFAYLIGRWLGKTPLFKRISPKKTWEGTIGGVICTLAISLVIARYIDQEHAYIFWLIAGFLTCCTAIFGDLFESMIKRSLNIKDSGNILPGHGGILDRFDAMLFTVPIFFTWMVIYSIFS